MRGLCIGQIEASTSSPWAFDTFAVSGRREFDYQSLPGGGEFEPHARFHVKKRLFLIERFVCCMTHQENLSIQ